MLFWYTSFSPRLFYVRTSRQATLKTSFPFLILSWCHLQCSIFSYFITHPCTHLLHLDVFCKTCLVCPCSDWCISDTLPTHESSVTLCERKDTTLVFFNSQSYVASIFNTWVKAFLPSGNLYWIPLMFSGNRCITFEGRHGCGRKICVYEIEMMEAQAYVFIGSQVAFFFIQMI